MKGGTAGEGLEGDHTRGKRKPGKIGVPTRGEEGILKGPSHHQKDKNANDHGEGESQRKKKSNQKKL